MAKPLRLLTVLVLLCALAAPSRADDPDSDPAALASAMTARLALMAPVARYKWNAGWPIEDLAREQVVLDRVVQAAETAGVQVDFARAFFQAQIDAAKIIQRRRFAQWRAAGHGEFAQVRDLNDELRPAIIGLTSQVIDGLARLPATSPSAICARFQRIPDVFSDDAGAWTVATAPLLDLAGDCPAPD